MAADLHEAGEARAKLGERHLREPFRLRLLGKFVDDTLEASNAAVYPGKSLRGLHRDDGDLRELAPAPGLIAVFVSTSRPFAPTNVSNDAVSALPNGASRNTE